MAGITEDQVVREVKEVVTLLGLQIQRINTGCFKVGKRFVRTCQKGTLDFEGYDNHGRFIGLECKRPKGGKVSPEQAERIKDINHKGGLATIVKSGADAYEFLLKNKCL